jgi:putative spermidine/putrescine transport system ATP-binding protein
MSYLYIENVSKGYGASQVLKNLDLHVEQGELVTLLGASGCGKSTLLRCISGLASLDNGEIYLEDKPITQKLPKDREVGMVFQSYALFPNLNVKDNIAFGLQMHKVSKQDIALRVKAMLKLVDLEDKIEAYPHQLSGGQQQRVALARSLSVQPKIMLMDEPLSALDAKIRKNLRLELRRIQKKLGMTTIFVTHDQEEALTISDRICVMNQGQIVQIGTPEEIYTRPRNEFVARFIGSYNVLSFEDMQRFNKQIDLKGNCFAIRPESIHLSHSFSDIELQQKQGFTAIGKVEEIHMLGNVLRFIVNVSGLIITIDMLNGDEPNKLESGSEVKVWIPQDAFKELDPGGV